MIRIFYDNKQDEHKLITDASLIHEQLLLDFDFLDKLTNFDKNRKMLQQYGDEIVRYYQSLHQKNPDQYFVEVSQLIDLVSLSIDKNEIINSLEIFRIFEDGAVDANKFELNEPREKSNFTIYNLYEKSAKE